eukprot:jgi/Pico_ML_1/54220/g4625.t2
MDGKHKKPRLHGGKKDKIIQDERMLDANPRLNLASFVTTWMEPEVEQLMQESLNVNFVDLEEYPSSSEIHNRCVNMLVDLYHGEMTDGAGTGTATVCWEKFCRYFEVEERFVDMEVGGPYVMDPAKAVELVDENTIGVCVILGSTYTGDFEDVKEVNRMLTLKNEATGWNVPIHVDAASGGFVAPFVYPDLEWDFRLPLVRSINTSKGILQVSFDVGDGLDGLKREIEKECGLHVAYQKLVCRGKVLHEGVSLVEQGVRDGAKVLVLSTDGGRPTAGQLHVEQERQRKKQWQQQKMKEAGYNSTGGSKPVTRVESSSHVLDKWKGTGIVGLRENKLKELPVQLTSLSVRHNRITDVHSTLWSMPRLKRVDLSHNQVRDLHGIDRCTSLEELHLEHNLIEQVPVGIGELKALVCLSLDRNRIASLPSALFLGCTSLHTLTVHGNPLTLEQLRSVDGYAQYDRRRRAKHDKQVDMRVFRGTGGFDEGADPALWRRW